jgi:hypothetical protein
VILRDFEREKTSAQSGKTEHHQDNRIDKKRFIRTFAATLPTLGEEQHTADRVHGNTANRQHRPRQIPLHLPSTSLHMAAAGSIGGARDPGYRWLRIASETAGHACSPTQ